MMRPTLVRLAAHAQARTPMIKFPGADRQRKPSHPAQPHPGAPKAVADAFSAFQAKQSTEWTVPLSGAGTAGGHGAAKGFGKGAVNYDYEGEWELPSRLRRGKYAPTEDEIEAILTGGATAAPKINKTQWYNAQI